MRRAIGWLLSLSLLAGCAEGDEELPPASACAVGQLSCGGGCCAPEEVCTESGCCPSTAPQPCGSTCCPSSFECLDPEEGTCVARGGTVCPSGTRCNPGEVCMSSGPGCMPEGGLDCGDGRYCAPGSTCVAPGAEQVSCSGELFEAAPGLPVAAPPGVWTELVMSVREEGEQRVWTVVVEAVVQAAPGTILEFELRSADGQVAATSQTVAPRERGASTILRAANSRGLRRASDWTVRLRPSSVAQVTDLTLRFPCPQQGCCPLDAPTGCGDVCCASGWTCADPAFDTCVPPGGEYCGQGRACRPGERCLRSGPGCMPEGAEDCGDGTFCDPGQTCAHLPDYPDGPIQCCADGTTACGDRCCAASAACVLDEVGGTCVQPGEAYCGRHGWTCPPGAACAFETAERTGGAQLGCVPAGAEDCGDGRYCAPGLFCADLPQHPQGPILCCGVGMHECGDRCCPSESACNPSAQGGTCVTPGGEYCGQHGWSCGQGQTCAYDTFQVEGLMQCIPDGADDCGDGTYCRPGYLCASFPLRSQDPTGCCAVGATACGDRCCPAGYSCHLGSRNGTCVAPGYQYCGEVGLVPRGYSCNVNASCTTCSIPGIADSTIPLCCPADYPTGCWVNGGCRCCR